MHELSLCGAIYEIVDRRAQGRPVSVINLQVGRLRQVVPETLTFCWTVVSDQTPLAGSCLAIDLVPVTLVCRRCSTTTLLSEELLLLCGACGLDDVSVATGEEFLLESLELTRG